MSGTVVRFPKKRRMSIEEIVDRHLDLEAEAVRNGGVWLKLRYYGWSWVSGQLFRLFGHHMPDWWPSWWWRLDPDPRGLNKRPWPPACGDPLLAPDGTTTSNCVLAAYHGPDHQDAEGRAWRWPR